MTISIWGKKKNVWRFLEARIRRIVPAYWIITLFTLLVIAGAQTIGLSSEFYPAVTIE